MQRIAQKERMPEKLVSNVCDLKKWEEKFFKKKGLSKKAVSFFMPLFYIWFQINFGYCLFDKKSMELRRN